MLFKINNFFPNIISTFQKLHEYDAISKNNFESTILKIKSIENILV